MNFYNEMMDANGGVRAHYKGYDDWLKATPPERIARKRAEADLAFHRVGITFAVYGEEAGKAVKYAEAFEICEYGRQPTPEEIRQLFPFLPKTVTD